jgi:hypothetical protein
MIDFTSRRDAFEAKFAHDEALRFKIAARRNNLLGLWAAERLGKSDAEAEAYARSVVLSDLEEPGHEDVVRRLMTDFAAAADPLSEIEIREMLERFALQAIEEIKSGSAPGPQHP